MARFTKQSHFPSDPIGPCVKKSPECMQAILKFIHKSSRLRDVGTRARARYWNLTGMCDKQLVGRRCAGGVTINERTNEKTQKLAARGMIRPPSGGSSSSCY